MYVSTILMVEPGVVGDPILSIWLEIETVASRAMNELPAMETLPDPVAKDRCSPSTQPLASSGSAAAPALSHWRGGEMRDCNENNINGTMHSVIATITGTSTP